MFTASIAGTLRCDYGENRCDETVDATLHLTGRTKAYMFDGRHAAAYLDAGVPMLGPIILPPGWTMVTEHGELRVRCPKHKK